MEMGTAHGTKYAIKRQLALYLRIISSRLLHCDGCLYLAVPLCFFSLCAYMRDCKLVYVVVLAFLLDFYRSDQG